MRETIIPVHDPRLSRPKGAPNSPNCVRAYRSDPEGITLQIRMANGSYVTTWLPFVAARTLAQGIIEACQENN